MCGIAKPINEIGPQNAVVIAVNRPTISSSRLRSRRVLIPKLSAYWGPKRRMFRGLTNSNAAVIPTKQRRENRGI